MDKAARLERLRRRGERYQHLVRELEQARASASWWPTRAELADALEAAARDTVRQAAAGARYDGLGLEWRHQRDGFEIQPQARVRGPRERPPLPAPTPVHLGAAAFAELERVHGTAAVDRWVLGGVLARPPNG